MQAPTPSPAPSDYLNFKAVLQARRAARAFNLQPASARHVLEVVAGYSNGTPAMPSYQTLAEDTGLGAYQVRSLIDRLVEAGYLAETRAPRKGGGWGKPMWALGPTCQLLPTPHMNGQVWPTPQSSVATPTLASVATATPKRDSVVHGDSVVPEETLEEKGPPTPQPAEPRQPYSKQKQTAKSKPDHVEPNGTRVGDYIAALTNAGHKNLASLSIQDKVYLNEQTFDVVDFAACMIATAEGMWPGADEWIKARLGIRNLHQHRYPRWVTRHTPTAAPAPNGAPDRVDSMLALMEEIRRKEDTAHDVRPVRSAPRALANPL